MKIACEYSHLGGAEILKVHYPEQEQEIYDVIEEVVCDKTKVSREKTMKGRMLYAPKLMNELFDKSFRDRGYKKLRMGHDVPTCNGGKIVKAYKEVDFVKDKVLVEVQFGKYAFMFYDMAKFQYFFSENHAAVGVEIVPCYDLHRDMSTGVSYGEQLIVDIERIKRNFPVVPIKIILVSMDDCEVFAEV